MSLIHVSGARPDCPTCHGTGVKPLFGFGTPCHCTEGFDDPYQQAVEHARADMKAAFDKVFNCPPSAKTEAEIKAIDAMTVVSPEKEL